MMQKFRTHLLGILVFLVVFGVFIPPAQSALLYRADFTGGSEKVVAGMLVDTPIGPGWLSMAPEDDSTGYLGDLNYVELPPSVLNLPEGSFRLIARRVTAEPTNFEALLSVLGPNGFSLVSFVPNWDRGYMGIYGLDNAKRDELWDFRVWLGRDVEKDDNIEFIVTWGADSNNNNIYVDGNKIQIQYMDDKFYKDMGTPRKTFADHLGQGASAIVLGHEIIAAPGTGEKRYWSPSNDTVLCLAEFYDTVVTPHEIGSPLAPAIKEVSHNSFDVAGYSGRIVHGDQLTVKMTAEPGGIATFDLGPIVDHPMLEIQPGVYIGEHVVEYGEDVEEGQVVGKFTSILGVAAKPLTATRLVNIDTKVYMSLNASNDLVPADESARSGLTVVAEDANGKAVRDHELKLTLSTTDEYTGTVGGGSFEDQIGGTIDVDWGGVTDSFGEVTAQYISGFAAKTILVSAKDMATGDVGVGWVRSFMDGTVDIVVTEPKVSALSVAGTMDISLSRAWLTADGQSRSRITAVVKDASGEPMSGHSVQFTLLGNNGTIRVVQSKTDSRGRAVADYIAGTIMGQVQVEVRDLTSGLTALVSIELRPDAPAEITLTAEPAEVVTGGETTVTAKVTDVNKNPNQNVDVIYNVLVGNGNLSATTVPTDEKGNASVTFTAGDAPGLVTLRGTVISREPSAEEISAAEGAVFLYGLAEDPGRLDVVEWLVEPGDEVVEGQPLVTLEDRADTVYTVVAPRDGILSTFMAEERDRVEYGDTLGYVLEVAE